MNECRHCKYDEKREDEYPCKACRNSVPVLHPDYPTRPFLFESKTKTDENDNVNRPAHYTDGKIEVIDFIEDKKLGFHLGNAVKYISRAGKKDPTKIVEDLKKAIWYLERFIEKLEEASEND